MLRVRITSVWPVATSATMATEEEMRLKSRALSSSRSGPKKSAATTMSSEQAELAHLRRADVALQPGHAAASRRLPRGEPSSPPPASPRRASRIAHLPPLAHHQDAVAQRQHLRQVGGDHDDADALRARARGSGRGPRPWRRRRCRASARRRSAASGRVFSHLASMTFCWLPPDSLPTGEFDRRRADVEALADRPRRSPLARRVRDQARSASR